MTEDSGLDAFKRWTPAAQEKAAAALREIRESKWKPWYCPNPLCNGRPHGPANEGEPPWDFPHSRADQRPPPGDWLTWAMLGGRGSGKTRGGSEFVHRLAKRPVRIALISPTGTDIRDTQVEGESGLLATAEPGHVPEWEPSKKKLTWPSGAVAYGYSGEEPDRLRGKQHHFAWLDEPAHMPLIEDVWDMLLFGLRLGVKPRICVTTTPLPTKWNKALVKDATAVITHASTFDNIDNLAETYRLIIARYHGTRRGLQEIEGRLLEDVEGALWSPLWIENNRVEETPELRRIIVSIDPAGSKNQRSDETGIVVVGTDGEHFYVIDDLSGKFSPEGWARESIRAYDKWDADYIVAERNYGGDMVKAVLRNALKEMDRNIRVETVNSRRGKALRADPIATLYERGMVHHIDVFDELEAQMTEWVPGNDSPDRLDALVHGVTALEVVAKPAGIGDPTQLDAIIRAAMAQRGGGVVDLAQYRNRGA